MNTRFCINMETQNSKEIKRFLKLRAKAQEKNDLKEESECCNVLGNEFLKEGDFAQALLMHKSEFNICQSLGDVIGRAIANRNIGDVYVAMNKFDEAIKHHTKHLELSSGNNVELQRAHTSLGRTYLEFGRSLSNRQEAKKCFTKSSDMLEKSLRIVSMLKEEGRAPQKETNAMKIRSLINLGICYHHLSGITTSNEMISANEKSKEYFQKAVYLAKRYNFTEDLYLANFILTTVNTDRKLYSHAVRNVEAAVQLAKTITNKNLLFQALDLCAQVYLMMENIPAAKAALKKLYKLSVKDRNETESKLKTVIKMCRIESEIASSEDKRRLFGLHEALSDMYCTMTCYHPAIKHYKIQEKLLKDLPGTTSQQKRSVYFSIASTLEDAGHFEEAIDYYHMEISSTTNKGEHSKTWSHIANCLEKQEADYTEVESAFQKALNSCEDVHDDLQKLRLLAALMEVQLSYKESQKASATKQEIAALEMKVGICVDEINDESIEEESCDTIGSLEDSEELFNAEMMLSDEDCSEDQERFRRRKKTNFSKTNEKGETLLHRACIEGQMKSVEVLVKQGHPVNPRDFCGWIPLHEACNHGYEDIVTFLLQNGAHVNDRGGSLCDNITPINDAAINGHFNTVELLLDHGADPSIASAQGKTALDSLVHYYQQHKEDLDSSSKRDYKALYGRLKKRTAIEANDVDGQNGLPQHVKSDCLKTGEESSSIDPIRLKPGRNATSTMSALISVDDVDAASQESCQDRHLSSNSISRKRTNQALCDLNDELPTLNKLSNLVRKQRRNMTACSVQPSQSGTSFVSAFGCLSDSNRRHNSSTAQRLKDNFPTRNEALPSLTCDAMTADDDNIVDDDDWLVPDDDPLSQPIKRHKRSIAIPRVHPASLSQWLNNEIPNEEAPATSNEVVKAPPRVQTIPPPTVGFRVKVKVNDKIFMFAVPGRDKTILWLAEKASNRFEEVTKLKPNISLSTLDGCLLSPDDAVCDVLNNNDTVEGKVESWSTVPFSQQYAESCFKEKRPVLPQIKDSCKKCETTKIFQLPNLGFSFKKHLKPLIQCFGQQELHKILLPGNRLGDVGVTLLRDVLNRPSPRTKVLLTELDLTCAGLGSDSLSTLSQCDFTKHLTHLNMSYNALRGCENLEEVLKVTTSLKVLILRNCWMSENSFSNFSCPFQGLQLLEKLDLSKNCVGARGIRSSLKILNRSKMKNFDLSEVADFSNDHVIVSYIAKFVGKSTEIIEALDLSGNHLTQSDVAPLRSVEHLVKDIKI